MTALRSTKEEEGIGEAASATQAQERLSAWTTSHSKRLFDVTLVLISLPLLIPLLLAVFLAIYISSGAPVLFRQIRIGRGRQPFTIYKFRTMDNVSGTFDNTIAALSPGQITTIGHLLRRTKLDELPQVFNVLRGEMSMVGPRPKIPEQQCTGLECRPGITGAATLAFAREDLLFAQLSAQQLVDFYRAVVLPIKLQIDSDYMARASLFSDLHILFRTITGRWGHFTDTSPLRSEVIRLPASRRDALEAQPLE